MLSANKKIEKKRRKTEELRCVAICLQYLFMFSFVFSFDRKCVRVEMNRTFATLRMFAIPKTALNFHCELKQEKKKTK